MTYLGSPDTTVLGRSDTRGGGSLNELKVLWGLGMNCRHDNDGQKKGEGGEREKRKKGMVGRRGEEKEREEREEEEGKEIDGGENWPQARSTR